MSNPTRPTTADPISTHWAYMDHLEAERDKYFQDAFAFSAGLTDLEAENQRLRDATKRWWKEARRLRNEVIYLEELVDEEREAVSALRHDRDVLAAQRNAAESVLADMALVSADHKKAHAVVSKAHHAIAERDEAIALIKRAKDVILMTSQAQSERIASEINDTYNSLDAFLKRMEDRDA